MSPGHTELAPHAVLPAGVIFGDPETLPHPISDPWGHRGDLWGHRSGPSHRFNPLGTPRHLLILSQTPGDTGVTFGDTEMAPHAVLTPWGHRGDFWGPRDTSSSHLRPLGTPGRPLGTAPSPLPWGPFPPPSPLGTPRRYWGGGLASRYRDVPRCHRDRGRGGSWGRRGRSCSRRRRRWRPSRSSSTSSRPRPSSTEPPSRPSPSFKPRSGGGGGNKGHLGTRGVALSSSPPFADIPCSPHPPGRYLQGGFRGGAGGARGTARSARGAAGGPGPAPAAGGRRGGRQVRGTPKCNIHHPPTPSNPKISGWNCVRPPFPQDHLKSSNLNLKLLQLNLNLSQLHSNLSQLNLKLSKFNLNLSR